MLGKQTNRSMVPASSTMHSASPRPSSWPQLLPAAVTALQGIQTVLPLLQTPQLWHPSAPKPTPSPGAHRQPPGSLKPSLWCRAGSWWHQWGVEKEVAWVWQPRVLKSSALQNLRAQKGGLQPSLAAVNSLHLSEFTGAWVKLVKHGGTGDWQQLLLIGKGFRRDSA